MSGIDLWFAFLFGWAFGSLLRLFVEYIANRNQPPEQLRKWFDE